MGQKSRSSLNVHSAFIDDLHEALLDVYDGISSLEQAVLAQRLPLEGKSQCLDEGEAEKARLYFHLYTVPVLEAFGLLDKKQWDAAVFWGAVQLCFGLHIRYADYVMDGDRVSLSLPRLTKQAQGYLAQAQSLLWSKGYSWTPEQATLYAQYIDYECDVEQGYFPDFSSLWRRVSPLCIVGDTYLASSIRAPEFRWAYRNFLSWSLVHADCDDVLEDLAAQRKTPVTILANERITNNSNDLVAIAKVMAHVKDVQAKQAKRLLEKICKDCPAWRTIILKMEKVFFHSV